MKDPRVVVYSREGCGHCLAVKAILANRRLPYAEYVVGRDLTRDELVEMYPGTRSLPVVVVDGLNIGGHSEAVEFFRRKTDL